MYLAPHHTDDRINGRCAAPRLPRMSISTPVSLFSCFSRRVQKRTILLDNASNLSLFLDFPHHARNGRQLKHGRMLAFAQPGEQHDLPAR